MPVEPITTINGSLRRCTDAQSAWSSIKTDGNDNEKRIVDALMRREEAISRLYRICGEVFGGYRHFWLALADDSLKHARWLGRLYMRTREDSGHDDTGRVDEDRFDVEAIEQSSCRIEGLCDSSNVGDIVQALENALELEEETLRCGYAEVFDSTTPEILQVQYCLHYSARKHFEMVRHMLGQLGHAV